MKLKINNKQKITAYVSISIIILSLIIWLLYGGEIFTKTEVLIEVKDDLFGNTKEWKDQFVWGLDLSLLISGITVLISLFVLYFQKDKRSNNEK